jgi:hypothetical protein
VIDREWKFEEGDPVRLARSWFLDYKDFVGQEGEVVERVRGLRCDAYVVALPSGRIIFEDSELEAA